MGQRARAPLGTPRRRVEPRRQWRGRATHSIAKIRRLAASRCARGRCGARWRRVVLEGRRRIPTSAGASTPSRGPRGAAWCSRRCKRFGRVHRRLAILDAVKEVALLAGPARPELVRGQVVVLPPEESPYPGFQTPDPTLVADPAVGAFKVGATPEESTDIWTPLA